MSRYSVLQAIFMSFYSRKLYRDVATNWGGKTILYLLFILSLSWIVDTYQFQRTVHHYYMKSGTQITAQVPLMTIKDGKLSTPENRPYVISDPDTKETIAVIDTSGQDKTLADAKASLLVTDTQVISAPKDNETRMDAIPKTLNTVIDPQVVNGYIIDYLNFLWLFIFIALVLGAFVYRILQGLVYSLVGLLFGSIAKAPLTYGQIMQIYMVAITPVIFIATVMDILSIHIAHELLYYFLLGILYLFYGILANRVKKEVAPN